VKLPDPELGIVAHVFAPWINGLTVTDACDDTGVRLPGPVQLAVTVYKLSVDPTLEGNVTDSDCGAAHEVLVRLQNVMLFVPFVKTAPAPLIDPSHFVALNAANEKPVGTPPL